MTAARAALAVLLGACVLGAPLATRAADLVTVKLVDDRFEPADLVLEHGKPYRLRLENTGKEMHEFKAAAFFAGAKIASGADVLTPDHAEIVVQPGQSKEIELTAPPAGSYELTCPDHDWDGMVGKITVR